MTTHKRTYHRSGAYAVGGVSLCFNDSPADQLSYQWKKVDCLKCSEYRPKEVSVQKLNHILELELEVKQLRGLLDKFGGQWCSCMRAQMGNPIDHHEPTCGVRVVHEAISTPLPALAEAYEGVAIFAEHFLKFPSVASEDDLKHALAEIARLEKGK